MHGRRRFGVRAWYLSVCGGSKGTSEILMRLVEGWKFRFDVERARFALVLQRMCNPGSDLQASGWMDTVEGSGDKRGLADVLGCFSWQYG